MRQFHPRHPRRLTFIEDLDITSFDGTEIDANLYIPEAPTPAGDYPTVLFTNSWGRTKPNTSPRRNGWLPRAIW